MIVLGVIRIRAAHHRSQQDDMADAEMAWDDSALNITVNPMEVRILRIFINSQLPNVSIISWRVLRNSVDVSCRISVDPAALLPVNATKVMRVGTKMTTLPVIMTIHHLMTMVGTKCEHLTVPVPPSLRSTPPLSLPPSHQRLEQKQAKSWSGIIPPCKIPTSPIIENLKQVIPSSL